MNPQKLLFLSCHRKDSSVIGRYINNSAFFYYWGRPYFISQSNIFSPFQFHLVGISIISKERAVHSFGVDELFIFRNTNRFSSLMLIRSPNNFPCFSIQSRYISVRSRNKYLAVSLNGINGSRRIHPVRTSRGPLPYGFSSLRSEEHTSELQSRFDLVCL